MEAEKTPSQTKPPNFSVYQNPALSAALTARSLQPSSSTFLCIFVISAASAFSLLAIVSRQDVFTNKLKFLHVSHATAYFLVKISQFMVALVFMGTILAFIRALSLHKSKSTSGISMPNAHVSKRPKEQILLTERQRGLIGLKPKLIEQADPESLKKPPKSRPYAISSPSDVLAPLHHSASSSNRSSRIVSEKQNTNGGKKIASYTIERMISPGSPLYALSSAPLQSSSVHSSPASTPWSKQRSSTVREISTEEMLEQFLADVDEKITESAAEVVTPSQTHMTPPAALRGFGPFGIASPSTTSGTTRSTPLRPVRISPGSQYNTPPKKGEGELPPPMSMEQTTEAFVNLGIYPHIDLWRDRLRQWFSSVLLNPLLEKIESSHIQVMQAAAKIGVSIAVNQVGSDSLNTGKPSSVSPIEGMKEWQPIPTLDEDGLLHQLRATLVQVLDASSAQLQFASLQPSQQNALIPVIQVCVDAITEHQRLHALMKGEWVKGLLPQSSVRADYTVQRIRELAEGTCLKNYEYLGNGEVYDKVNKKWTLELPTDSHLLLYLFCAFLEHPKWMLHVDPTSYASAQSSKNPLYLGILPPKERFPEKYVVVISGVPSVLHPGACVLVVGKQSPPIFALYWDKKMQFSLQGRTALWDAVLLLCHKIKFGYGGVVRGMHIGSSAFGILPVLDSETED